MDTPIRGQGEFNGNAKLREDDVRHIRHLLDTHKAKAPEIAKMYKLSTETVRRIGRRETWNWIADAPAISDEVLMRAGQDSLQRFLAANPDLAEKARIEGAVAEDNPMEKLAQDIKRAKEKDQQGDKLIDELTGGKKQ